LQYKRNKKIVESDFPNNELERIDIHLEDGDSFLFGDLSQLSFCFETILSYLIRFLPEDQKVHVNVTTDKDRLEAKIGGTFPGLKTTPGEGGATR
jgi:signal transduction histidine kinase